MGLTMQWKMEMMKKTSPTDTVRSEPWRIKTVTSEATQGMMKPSTSMRILMKVCRKTSFSSVRRNRLIRSMSSFSQQLNLMVLMPCSPMVSSLFRKSVFRSLVLLIRAIQMPRTESTRKLSRMIDSPTHVATPYWVIRTAISVRIMMGITVERMMDLVTKDALRRSLVISLVSLPMSRWCTCFESMRNIFSYRIPMIPVWHMEFVISRK